MSSERESYLITEVVMRELAPAISVLFKQSIPASGLKRKTGRSTRGFTYKIFRDRTTLEPWGLAFSTVRYVYMHHHGMEARSQRLKNRNYRHPGYSSRGMLVEPAKEGARMIADRLAEEQADFIVKVVGFKLGDERVEF